MLYPSQILIHDGPTPILPQGRGGEGDPDTLWVDESPSIGIEVIRNIAPFINQKPYQHAYKIVGILHADRLTIQAQNALLKTLEEPPENTQLILITSRKDALLSTILSRCQIAHSRVHPVPTSTENPNLPITYPNAFALAEKLGKTREEAITWCEKALVAEKKHLEDTPSQKRHTTVKHLVRTINLLRKNVNARLALEECFFKHLQAL